MIVYVVVEGIRGQSGGHRWLLRW